MNFLLFQIYYHNPKTRKRTNQTSLKSFWPKIIITYNIYANIIRLLVVTKKLTFHRALPLDHYSLNYKRVLWLKCCCVKYWLDNIHANISAFWLAESMPVNPKQCRKLKLSAKRWNWVQKVEIKMPDIYDS